MGPLTNSTTTCQLRYTNIQTHSSINVKNEFTLYRFKLFDQAITNGFLSQ